MRKKNYNPTQLIRAALKLPDSLKLLKIYKSEINLIKPQT